jgi:hypothetical protein
MSTRGNICVKVRKGDFDRVNDVVEKYGRDKVTEEAPYLYIYNHFDSFPEDLGKELLNNYDSYTKALSLVLEGDCSYPDRPYSLREPYANVCPKTTDKLEDALNHNYLYVYDTEWECYDSQMNKLTI